jgi:hypothetical protein
MQYILTQKEYDELWDHNRIKYQKVLQNAGLLILKHANFMCIHDQPDAVMAYCDNCPLIGSGNLLCTKTKTWSKEQRR